MSPILFAFAISLLAGGCLPSPGPAQRAAAQSLADFESQLDALRAQLAIPGMSAIVMRRDSVVWEGSLGMADVASQRRVTPETQFHLASLTKPFASTILLQLVEDGRVSLDDSVGKYGINIPSSGVIRVRHLLSHTSEGTPGEAYRYNGNRYAELDRVIRGASNESFAQRLTDRIIKPLSLERTAPNPYSPAFATSGKNGPAYIADMATGYGVDAQTRPVPVGYPTSFSGSAGLVSTAREVARFSTALDAGQFLKPATRTLAYTPARSSTGQTFPYALGWFVSNVDGHTLVWHYGYWIGNSSLIIKEPSRGLTFVVLTNSDQLSARFRLGSGDLMSSTVAQAFVRAFVTGPLGK
jgi:CubicO group peptidase (beta-lactamase class C family)